MSLLCKVLYILFDAAMSWPLNLKLYNFDRLISGLVLLLQGVNLNERCSWCHYLSCVPTSKWSCDEPSIYCEVSAHFFCIFQQCYFLIPRAISLWN